MKQLSIALITILFATVFTSCKKDSVTPNSQTSAIAGIWDGTYHYNGSTNEYPYRLQIKAGGVIERLDGTTVDGVGSWTLSGNNFSATYKNLPSKSVTYTITATWDETSKKLTGETASSNPNIFTSFFMLVKM